MGPQDGEETGTVPQENHKNHKLQTQTSTHGAIACQTQHTQATGPLHLENMRNAPQNQA